MQAGRILGITTSLYFLNLPSSQVANRAKDDILVRNGLRFSSSVALGTFK